MQTRSAWPLVAALAACVPINSSDSPVKVEAPPECNPLAAGACLLPWPSSAYLVVDATTKTGFRVNLPEAAMPVNIDGIRVAPASLNRFDGFSPDAVIVAGFATGVSPEGLPSPAHIDASVGPDASVVLLNETTGERVPLMAEVDQNIPEPTERALLIRPLVRLRPASRYVVAIRKAVRAPDGSELPLSPAFQALVAGREVTHPLLANLHYPEIFSTLESAGVPRSDLVLAWDFVTASDDFLTGDLLSMRDQALEAMTDDGAHLTFDGEEEEPGDAHTLRFITGTYDSPLFLTAGESDASILSRDSGGRPALMGTYRARFAALIPACVADAPGPVPLVVFGHGLFGSAADALHWGFLREIADKDCVVFVGTDFIGLSGRDFATVALAVNDLNRVAPLVEKLPQAVVNFMALTRVAKGAMAASPLFAVDGRPVIDPERVYYYGASLGGIMGNVFMAYEPSIERGVLGVPGGAWTLLFERSFAWPPLRGAMQSAYPAPFAYATNVAMMGMGFDLYDPITTAPRVVGDPLPGVPAKQIFLYEAVDDCLVSNLSTDMLVRTMGLPVIGPSVRVPDGLVEVSGQQSGGLIVIDEHPTPAPPAGNLAPEEDNGTHEGSNKRAGIQRAVKRFLETGELAQGCLVDDAPAPCDCATGACD